MTNSPAQPASGPPRPWVIGAGSFLRPRSWVIGQFLLLLLLFCGCTPPGPRALLKGQRLIQEGKYEQAVESLQVAARLLPKNAQAFNHLGLALHGNKQYARALVAYQKALELDHKLASARYNMGCLLLEQNDLTGATDQLTSYTLLQANSVDGWLKLASAQLRARKLDPAEKSFKTALGLQPRHPEALNGLGVIQLQRRRPQEALNYFNVALSQNPAYGPALLNAALLSQQYLNNRPAALEKYRQYLVLQPRPPNWEAVSAVANRLDAELNPPPPAPVAQSIAALPPPPPTNLAAKSIPPAPSPKTNFLARATPPPRASSNHPAQTVSAVVTRTNLTTVAPPKIAAQTNQVVTNPFVVAISKPPPEPLKPPLPLTNPPPVVAEKAPEVEITQVPEELVVKPPEEILVVRPPVVAPPAPVERASATPVNPPAPAVTRAEVKPESKPDKRGLFSRLNPFGGKPKASSKDRTSLASPEPPPTNPIVVAARETNVSFVPAVQAPPPPPAFARYSYLSPLRPASGNRHEAERFFAEGIRAQQAGRPTQAVAAYQKATQLDPAYFEAYYNQGLAAYAIANYKESLIDYERALAIKPNSADARYNFALALQHADYPLDAADELLEILNEKPAETRAHLLLANLYSRQLNQPKQARAHYLKVLESDPRHPKAPEIRYWLAANP